MDLVGGKLLLWCLKYNRVFCAVLVHSGHTLKIPILLTEVSWVDFLRTRGILQCIMARWWQLQGFSAAWIYNDFWSSACNSWTKAMHTDLLCSNLSSCRSLSISEADRNTVTWGGGPQTSLQASSFLFSPHQYCRWYLEFLSGIAKDWRNKFAEKDQQFNFIHPVSNFCISVWAQQEVTLLTVTLFTFFFSPLLNINISLHSYTPLYLELIFNYLLNQTGKLGCSTWSQWDWLERWTCSLGRVGWEWELLCQPQDHARTPHPSILWRHKMTTLPGQGQHPAPNHPENFFFCSDTGFSFIML